MQLSSRCHDCWSYNILPAMNGLTKSYMFRERLLKCEPIDLGRFVVDLSERHIDYWAPYYHSATHPQERNSKRSNYHQWCALPTKRALVACLPYILPRHMFLDLPQDVIRIVARFRLRAHTLQAETMTWTHNTSPSCDLCNVNGIQDEQHVLFHRTHLHWVSLCRTYASVSSRRFPQRVCFFESEQQ